MTAVFLDTAGWFAALSPKEARHKAALAVYRRLIERKTALVTTNLVVAEMQILVSRFRGAAEGVRFLDSLYQDPLHEVVFVDRDIERQAVDRWLRRFNEHRLSLADAVSFEVMRARRMRQVLTLDAHFELPGFETLP